MQRKPKEKHSQLAKFKTKIPLEVLVECLKQDTKRGCIARIARKLNVCTRTIKSACVVHGLPIPSYPMISIKEREQENEANKRNNKSTKTKTAPDPRSLILAEARVRAKQKGIECNLAISDIVIPSHCPVLGIPLIRNTGGNGFSPNSPSLDRVNNLKGYLWDNVIVVSWRANHLKNNASLKELQAIVDFYKNYHPPISRVEPVVYTKIRASRVSNKVKEEIFKDYTEIVGISKSELATKYCLHVSTILKIIRAMEKERQA